MADPHADVSSEAGDKLPGDDTKDGIASPLIGYTVGLALATALTIGSFVAAGTHLIYGPGVPAALVALAVAQMGVHLAFFLHITTGDDNINNVMALAFGVLIVGLVIFGSLWIMSHLNHNMMPDMRMEMQRGF